MWDLILNRCPNLQSLSIGGHGFSDFPRVTQGRWMKLHTLKVDYFANDRAYGDFLVAHPTLRTLEASRAFTFFAPVHPDLGPLPKLDSLAINGWFETHNQPTLASFRSITRLDLSLNSFVLQTSWLVGTCLALYDLHSLRSLCMQFAPSSAEIVTFRDIIMGCTRLTSFELVATSPFDMVR